MLYVKLLPVYIFLTSHFWLLVLIVLHIDMDASLDLGQRSSCKLVPDESSQSRDGTKRVES